MGVSSPFHDLYQALTAGRISRRRFIEGATALGTGAAVATFCANAARVAASGAARRNGWAVYAKQGAARTPDAGTEGQQRGAGGDLKVLQWQAPTLLGTHSAIGGKDIFAAALVTEPLMHYLADGTLIPHLVTEVPSVENGLLSKDLTTVTYKILPGVTWNDGQPFTAADVAFTHRWITHPANNSINFNVYSAVAKVETPDALTAVLTFENPSAAWFESFTGSYFGGIYPQHAFRADADPNDGFSQHPIGTGPYVVESFAPDDQVVYAMNERYREPSKPFFSKVNLKGGGDPESAARAVLETGDWDYAPLLQAEPDVLRAMEQSGGKGTVVIVPGTFVERLNLNFSDPNREVDGQRSHFGTPHPIFSDLKVRQALNLAVPRDTIANQFYFGQEGEPPTANVLTGIASFTSPNTSWAYDPEQAARLLDEAGWVLDGGVRMKDGMAFTITYVTTITPVRQQTQQVVKQAFKELGIDVTLMQVDAGVFFDTSPGNEQNVGHFYTDVNMYTTSATSPVATRLMDAFYTGPNGVNIAQKENGWTGGTNLTRYANPEYDRVFEQLRAETDQGRAAQLLIQLNDILINDVAVIPIVNRASDKYAISNTLRDENVMVGPGFEGNYWNIANWNRTG
jgi:peptide/nickel transport system substrate-binding protein